MKIGRQIPVFLTIMLLGFTFLANVRAQGLEGTLGSFLDTAVLGVRIQVDATAQARPGENITVILVFTAQPNVTEINVQSFNLSIIGFLNGTNSILMKNVYNATGFSLLSNGSQSYNYTILIPEWVSGKTFGQITLSHWATYQGTIAVYNNASVCGFYMTDIENVYLENLQQNYQQLNQSYTQLQQNYTQLQQNLTDALRGNTNSLDSARTVITVLMITTIFFVATTLYLVIRKPKGSW